MQPCRPIFHGISLGYHISYHAGARVVSSRLTTIIGPLPTPTQQVHLRLPLRGEAFTATAIMVESMHAFPLAAMLDQRLAAEEKAHLLVRAWITTHHTNNL